MATFIPGQTVRTQDPTVEVTVSPNTPLPVGSHRFQLVVVDDSGLQSEPAIAEIIVIDSQRPTAVLDAPRAGTVRKFVHAVRRAVCRPGPGKNHRIPLGATPLEAQRQSRATRTPSPMTQRLFVYGTLAPGRPNEHVLADVPGEWEAATVSGRLLHEGWGAAVGYPGITKRRDGTTADVYIYQLNDSPLGVS